MKRSEISCLQIIEEKFKAVKIERIDPNPAKTKKTKIADHNKAITSELLSNFRR